MRIFIFLSLFLSSVSFGQSFQTFHNFKEVTITGDSLDLSTFAGKKVLVVNTASFCGYTPQFAPLQLLDSLYESYGFEVIGFPCNDFSNQDPHSDSVINQFCLENYGVHFQMMHKVDVVSGDTAEVFKWLQNANRNGVATAHITWNFNKFLIDRQGKWVRHFSQTTNPLDTAITNWIKAEAVTETNVSLQPYQNVGFVNPSNSTLKLIHLETQNLPVQIRVSDIMGRCLSNFKLESLEQTIPLTGLSDGFYTVRIMGKEGIRNLRWVVKN